MHIFGNISNRQSIRPDEFVKSIHKEDRHNFVEAMRQSLQGVPFQIDLRTITRDKKLRYLHARSSKITQDESGTVTHVFGTLQDISERKELENKLMLLNQELEQRVSERTHEVQRQVSAMDSTRAGMSLLLDGRYIYMNPAHAEMYGYKPQELMGETWEILYDPEQVEMFKVHVFPVLNTKGVWTGEVLGKRKDGSVFDAEVTLQYSSGGELICTCNDISFRKQMERQIRASEARYRVLLEQAPVALLVNNYNTDSGLYSIIYANPAAVKLLGASGAEDLIGHSAYDFMSAESRQLSINRISQFLGNARPGPAEYEYFRIDTHESIYLQVASIVIDFDGQPAFLSVLTDITDRRHFEMKLVASEERYRAIVESQQELICRFKPDSTLTYVNPAYCAYFDKTEAELLGQSWLNLIPADQHATIRQHIATLLETGGSVTYEHEAISQDGTIQWQRWTDQVLVHGENEEIELQSVGVDITELKRVQMRLENALAKERELSELKSRFVSMTSHEFRTPLASIRATSETLRDFYDRMTDVDRRKRFERINGQIEHMAAMLDDILLIGRLEEGQITANFEYLNIGEYLRSIIEEFRSIRLTHQVIYQSEAHDLEVFADRKLIRQIFTNLLTNAAQYSSPESRIQIRLHQDDQDAVLEVIDEGIGIPEADQKHLFTAFHRAENVGNIKGTGLGLAIAKRAVELHGGSIRFTSQLGEGTTFTVRIPIEQATVMQGQRGQ
jgi:PAS domain S-box-containing protein